MFKIVVLLVTMIFGSNSFEFPSFITKCTCDDTLPECYIDNVVAVKPHLKDGIAAFAIPKLVPFHIDSLTLEAGKDLTLKLTNVDVHDLDSYAKPTMTSNLHGHNLSISFVFDAIHITGMYEVDGKILVLPIKGSGPISITMEKLECTYGYSYQIVDRDGTNYFQFSDSGFDFKTSKLVMQLDNLFNGDKALGDEVNAFLNENWQEVEELIRGPISDTVKHLIGNIIHELGENVPADDVCVISDISSM